MWGRIEDHDVTCLCANVGLPKRCIVEALPPEGGRARFQLQAFTSGGLAEAIEWVEPVLSAARGGVRRRRWSGEFEFARLEVEDREAARALERAFGVASAVRPGGLLVAFEGETQECEPAERLAFLSRALAAVG